MALLFLFSVTKKEGESSLPCPDIYLVTSRKVGVIQVLSLVSVRVLQRSRTRKMEMHTHENIREVVGAERGGDRERGVSFLWMWPEPELSDRLSLNYYNENTIDWIVCALVCMLKRPHGLLPARLLCPWNSPARILEWVTMPSSRGSS